MRQPPLSDRVATAISANRRLRHVQTYTNGNAVTLSGKVFDSNDKTLAERIARGVGGVSSVSNYITTSTDEWAQNQARIARELQNAGLSGVSVKVIGSSAYLSGQVKTDLDKQRAVTVAEQAAPVKVRENLITVAPGSMFGF
jgi:osmotically-inducible protein OsmY